MSKDGTVAVISEPKMCDICTQNGDPNVPAGFDAKTKMGPWANMCSTHYGLYGIGLGTGKGQRLVLEEDTYRENPMREGFDCALHGTRHPMNAAWDCYEDLLAQAIEQAG